MASSCASCACVGRHAHLHWRLVRLPTMQGRRDQPLGPSRDQPSERTLDQPPHPSDATRTRNTHVRIRTLVDDATVRARVIDTRTPLLAHTLGLAVLQLRVPLRGSAHSPREMHLARGREAHRASATLSATYVVLCRNLLPLIRPVVVAHSRVRIRVCVTPQLRSPPLCSAPPPRCRRYWSSSSARW